MVNRNSSQRQARHAVHRMSVSYDADHVNKRCSEHQSRRTRAEARQQIHRISRGEGGIRKVPSSV